MNGLDHSTVFDTGISKQDVVHGAEHEPPFFEKVRHLWMTCFRDCPE
jgi:hypothetical protein